MEKLELEDLIKFSKTVRVLYIEGNNKLREDSFGVFKIFFHNIDTAKDAEEGYKYFLNNKYDLIITSVELPKMNGVDLITKIRDISKHITILILSSDTAHFIDLIRLGIDGYILKPVEVKQFTSVIQKTIEKLKVKQELYEYKNSLEDKVIEKTKELESLNKTLEKRVEEEVQKNKEKDKLLAEQVKMVALDELLGNIAHQWRQPLSAITTASTSLKFMNELDMLTGDDIDQNMDFITTEANLLSETIESFRDMIHEPERVPINDIVDSAIDIFESNKADNKLNIINCVEKEESLELVVLKDKFEQVVLNILNNANDIFGKKNIKDGWVKLTLDIQESSIILAVEDNGGGINNDILTKIFDPYFTTKHQARGTGLGLHICYKIVTDSLNGKIEAKNGEYGAIFLIELPIV